MFNKGQLAGLMKQAQAMQDNLKKAQDELAFIEVEGESGAGLVKVLMTCKHDVKRITIDPSLLAEDKDMLEDLVAAAFNAAVRKAEETSQEKMGKLTARHARPPRRHEIPVLRLATERAICVVGRCSESSRTASTFRFLCSVRLAAHPARYALEGGVGQKLKLHCVPVPFGLSLSEPGSAYASQCHPDCLPTHVLHQRP
jgi:DNA-binding YbaB/EbfC family protein